MTEENPNAASEAQETIERQRAQIATLIEQRDDTTTLLEEERNEAALLRTQRDEARRGLEAWKANLVTTVATYDHGCRDGKRDFLRVMDLELPPKRYTANVSITVEFDCDDETDSTEVEQRVRSCWNYEGDTALGEVDCRYVEELD